MKQLLAIAFTLFSGAAAIAAPGEWWEITSKVEMPGMPFAMPENTVKVCVAKEAASDPRQTMQDKDCRATDIKTSGNRTTWKVRCDRNGTAMSGAGEVTSTRDSYQGTMQLSGNAGGMKMDMTTRYRGKRVGPACDSAQAMLK